MTDLSTRPAGSAAARPPRKWLGRKGGLLIVALGTVLWFGTVLFEVIVFHANEAPTNALIIGAFTVASAFVYTMAYRLRPSDKLSVTRLLLAFLVGGLLSTTLAGPIDALDNLWSGGTTSSSGVSLTSLSLAGVVEEFVKILIVMLVSIGLTKKNVRNGLFLGGAVGFGFAAIEDIGYARAAWNEAYAAHTAALPPEIMSVILRDVTGIFGHPLFTALLAAAVFGAVRNGRFRLTGRVVLAYVGVAFAHGLFDAIEPIVYRLTLSRVAAEVAFYGYVVIEALVLSLIWRTVSRRANQQTEPFFRQAVGADVPFLANILVDVADWDGKRGVTLESAFADKMTWRYVMGWQRTTDFGIIAMDGARPIGAAWTRYFDREHAGYGYVSDSIPELTIGVVADQRGHGVGEALLRSLISGATDIGLPGISLSVEDGNDRARRLYEKLGFRHVGRSGGSDTMLLELSRARVMPSAEPSAGGPFGAFPA
jgi:protease PrsW